MYFVSFREEKEIFYVVWELLLFQYVFFFGIQKKVKELWKYGGFWDGENKRNFKVFEIYIRFCFCIKYQMLRIFI